MGLGFLALDTWHLLLRATRVRQPAGFVPKSTEGSGHDESSVMGLDFLALDTSRNARSDAHCTFREREYRQVSSNHGGHNQRHFMGKPRDAKKMIKKAPKLTAKEKKAAKRNKP